MILTYLKYLIVFPIMASAVTFMMAAVDQLMFGNIIATFLFFMFGVGVMAVGKATWDYIK